MTTIDSKSNSLHDESFDLHLLPLTKDWYFSRSGNDNYSLSGFTAILDRSPNKFLMNTYLPTSLLTIASFIGFLIPVDMVPGRMALLVTIFLMIVNIRSKICMCMRITESMNDVSEFARPLTQNQKCMMILSEFAPLRKINCLRP